MSEWVMLQAPEVLLCYGGGLLCFLLERAWQASRGWLTWLGGALAVIAHGTADSLRRHAV